MSDFYRNLVLHYDDIFPMEPQIRDFLASAFKAQAPGPVLDVACGTGSYALALAGLGFQTTGVDLDEDMIAGAKRKNAAGHARFLVADMRSLSFAPDGAFRCSYCIGNSIPHLEDRTQIAQALTELRRVLAAGGTMLVQIINFDRINRNGGRGELPELRRKPGLRFLRRYLPLAAWRVWFDTELRIEEPAGGRVHRQRLPLLALESGELSELAAAAGFEGIELFGDFAGRPFDPAASMLCILKGKKSS